MTKTEVRGALRYLSQWEKSDDDLPPEELEPAYLQWLIRQLAKERDDALRRLARIHKLAEG